MRRLIILVLLQWGCTMEKQTPPPADPTAPVTLMVAKAAMKDFALPAQVCEPRCEGGVMRIGTLSCGSDHVGTVDCGSQRTTVAVNACEQLTLTTHCPLQGRHACDEPCVDGFKRGRRRGAFVCGQNDQRGGDIDCGDGTYPAQVSLPQEPCPAGSWEARTKCEYRIPNCDAGPGECCPEPGRVVPAGGGLDGYCGHWDGSCSICICLADTTAIATPYGAVRVTELRTGMLVYTQTADGRRTIAPIVRTTRTPVPATHHVIRVVLADGRRVDVSPGHPDMTGRGVELLAPDAQYDGAMITSVERIAYDHGATYDLLPAGETGIYWADGVPLGSTLRGHGP